MKQRIMSYLLVILFFSSLKGGEFQINTRTSQSQANADITAGPNGGFIAVWSSYYSTSGRSNDIFCRIFEPNCSPVRGEFQINQAGTGNQSEPAVAANSSGKFIAAWQGPGSEGNGVDIFAQFMDAKGLPVGDELHVNNIKTQNDQTSPNLAMNESGSLVIVWESEIEPNTTIICCRQYDNNGTPLNDEFQVSVETDSRYPDVAVDPNGNFSIVWLEGNKSNYSIMARLYNFDGVPVTEPFKVSAAKIISLTQPAVVQNSSGCFLITWDGDPNLAGNDDIHARIYEPNGTPAGEQFVVNSTLEKAQQNPQAAINDAGQFVIVWDCDGDPNTNKKDIFAQRFNDKGEHIGDEVRLNTYTDSDQKCPAVAFIDDGRFVTVWQSMNQDGSNYGIFGESEQIISAADFNMDGYINFVDYNLLAEEWHKNETSLVPDLINDGIIDNQDLLGFCQNWLNPYCE
ncbi:MAG: hypothetical protein JW787_09480 [Sedimentisphaerales bacterium]|nr:hypothetical protein [Sedimentisphaerales bacterium]